MDDGAETCVFFFSLSEIFRYLHFEASILKQAFVVRTPAARRRKKIFVMRRVKEKSIANIMVIKTEVMFPGQT